MGTRFIYDNAPGPANKLLESKNGTLNNPCKITALIECKKYAFGLIRFLSELPGMFF